MPRPHPFVSLRHIGQHRVRIHREPPCRHRSGEKHLAVLSLRINKVIPAAYLPVCLHIPFIHCLRHILEHRILFGRRKINQVVYGSDENVTLQPLSLRRKAIMVSQNLQCTVQVNT